jgi:hypothetical protein
MGISHFPLLCLSSCHSVSQQHSKSVFGVVPWVAYRGDWYVLLQVLLLLLNLRQPRLRYRIFAQRHLTVIIRDRFWRSAFGHRASGRPEKYFDQRLSSNRESFDSLLRKIFDHRGSMVFFTKTFEPLKPLEVGLGWEGGGNGIPRI